MTDRPRSKRPESWPRLIREAIVRATRQEVLVPFENADQCEKFRKTIMEIRRSYREHEAPDWEAVNGIRAQTTPTLDIKELRPTYRADPLLYPFTIILSPAMGFLPNLEIAHASTQTIAPTVTHIDNLNDAAFVHELENLVHETTTGEEDVDLLHLIRSRGD